MNWRIRAWIGVRSSGVSAAALGMISLHLARQLRVMVAAMLSLPAPVFKYMFDNLFARPGLHPPVQLSAVHVLDVAAEHPLVTERVPQPALPVAVELVRERVDHLAARRHRPRPQPVHVRHG